MWLKLIPIIPTGLVLSVVVGENAIALESQIFPPESQPTQTVEAEPVYSPQEDISPNVTVETEERVNSPSSRVNREQASPEQDFDLWYAMGIDFLAAGQTQEAIIPFQRALRINPDFFEGWLGLGYTFWTAQQYDESLEAYDRAIAINENSSYAWFNRGVTLNALKRYEDAIASYQTALDLDQDWQGVDPAEVWFGLGHALSLLEDYEEALQAYEQALQLNPEHSGYLYGRGKMLIALDRHEEGLEVLSQALSGNGRWGNSSASNAWVDRGIALEEMERYPEAIYAYEQALKLDPDNRFARANLTQLQEAIGDR